MYRRVYDIVMPLLYALASYGQSLAAHRSHQLGIPLADAINIDAEPAVKPARPQTRGMLHPAPPRTQGEFIRVCDNVMRLSRALWVKGQCPLPAGARRLLNRDVIARMPDPITSKSSKAIKREKLRLMREAIALRRAA